jgi:hypothetical protein
VKSCSTSFTEAARTGSQAATALQIYGFLRNDQRAYPASQQAERSEEKFRRLAADWRAANTFTSSITQIVTHPSYLAIIGMGMAVVPLLLEDLQREPDHWAPALTAITGVDPVSLEDEGDMEAIADAWLAWGRVHGFTT